MAFEASHEQLCTISQENEEAPTLLTVEDKLYDRLCANDNENPHYASCETLIAIVKAAKDEVNDLNRPDYLDQFQYNDFGPIFNRAQKYQHVACLFEHASKLIEEPDIVNSEQKRSEYILDFLEKSLHYFYLAGDLYHKSASYATADQMYKKVNSLTEKVCKNNNPSQKRCNGDETSRGNDIDAEKITSEIMESEIPSGFEIKVEENEMKYCYDFTKINGIDNVCCTNKYCRKDYKGKWGASQVW
eukprot:CAMPEP_0114650878 /NCGR_PEP_ID=MMETSP0191-20121206/7953_1 /TAXON_ID=126664 /ORGANISM="Sorites sp." /LENGTH=244 /DNA_ID=CAMNT_0001864871 /DNA_START=142 /DNA_END=873 /DNA_ORIENTATION=-